MTETANTPKARIHHAAGPLRRFEAWFSGKAYAPHRHDSYTICVTLGGVQSFTYRGARRAARAGDVVILHPDEMHDGEAGTDEPFGYRALALDPVQLRPMLGDAPLPFIDGGVSNDPELARIAGALLTDFDEPDDDDLSDHLHTLADTLLRVGGHTPGSSTPDTAALDRVHEFLCETLDRPVDMEELEAIAGRSRWQVSRDFRHCHGTSPYRFSMMRRLDAARTALATGQTLADTAYAFGFADQAHFTRQFKSAYGQTPRAWQRACRTILQ